MEKEVGRIRTRICPDCGTSNNVPDFKQKPEQDSRREHKRLKTKLQVYFGPTKETILSGFSVDISAGGLFLQTKYPFKQNDELRLIFTLPDQEASISCDAKVAWANTDIDGTIQETKSGVGLEFVNLSLENLMSISKFIDESDIESDW